MNCVRFIEHSYVCNASDSDKYKDHKHFSMVRIVGVTRNDQAIRGFLHLNQAFENNVSKKDFAIAFPDAKETMDYFERLNQYFEKNLKIESMLKEKGVAEKAKDEKQTKTEYNYTTKDKENLNQSNLLDTITSELFEKISNERNTLNEEDFLNLKSYWIIPFYIDRTGITLLESPMCLGDKISKEEVSKAWITNSMAEFAFIILKYSFHRHTHHHTKPKLELFYDIGRFEKDDDSRLYQLEDRFQSHCKDFHKLNSDFDKFKFMIARVLKVEGTESIRKIRRDLAKINSNESLKLEVTLEYLNEQRLAIQGYLNYGKIFLSSLKGNAFLTKEQSEIQLNKLIAGYNSSSNLIDSIETFHNNRLDSIRAHEKYGLTILAITISILILCTNLYKTKIIELLNDYKIILIIFIIWMLKHFINLEEKLEKNKQKQIQPTNINDKKDIEKKIKRTIIFRNLCIIAIAIAIAIYLFSNNALKGIEIFSFFNYSWWEIILIICFAMLVIKTSIKPYIELLAYMFYSILGLYNSFSRYLQFKLLKRKQGKESIFDESFTTKLDILKRPKKENPHE